METLQLILNVVTVVFIVATMVSAGLGSTLDSLGRTFRNFGLVALVLVANLIGCHLPAGGRLPSSDSPVRRSSPWS
jgi:hypothetical protein